MSELAESVIAEHHWAQFKSVWVKPRTNPLIPTDIFKVEGNILLFT